MKKNIIDMNLPETPFRSAPVLYGKDAENFYKIWAESLKEPTRVPSKEKREEIRKSLRECNMIK